MKKKTSTIMLILICIMIILYTVANFALQYFTTIEVSPTLTTAWFAFWGTELVALAAIKNQKVKYNYDKIEYDKETIEEVIEDDEEIAD